MQWVDSYEAEVVLIATLFRPSGKTFLAEREYRATAHDDYDKDNALLKASVMAVSKLLQDITPRYATQEIRMDDDDDAQKPIIQMAQQGNIPDALDAMESYVESNPNNAPARYNLAVLLDASGRYAEALGHYRRAMALANKDYYPEMKRACLRRKFNQEALSQDSP
jgi:tetratricopeptide (TPR) repeat protein